MQSTTSYARRPSSDTQSSSRSRSRSRSSSVDDDFVMPNNNKSNSLFGNLKQPAINKTDTVVKRNVNGDAPLSSSPQEDHHSNHNHNYHGRVAKRHRGHDDNKDDDSSKEILVLDPKSDDKGNRGDEDSDNETNEKEDSADDDDSEDLLRRILATAASRGIPLDFLAYHGQHDEEEDNLEYPFDHAPQSLQDVADFIKSPKCQNILVLAGAGMSVASGIPDFRSPNGLYATLNANLLSTTDQIQRDRIRLDPTYCLDQHLFLENPLPCLEVLREFILGVRDEQWKATLAHRFVELLSTQTSQQRSDDNTNTNSGGKLVRLYTQNIDGLEDQCHSGLPHSLRIAVHGSMDEAACAVCHAPMDFHEFCNKVQTQIKDITGQDPKASSQSKPIRCNVCASPCVKPTIVLFRSSLPREFFEHIADDVQKTDLLLIIGTSLHVAPANSLVWRVPKTAMRVLINQEAVGKHLGMDFEDDDDDHGGIDNDNPVMQQQQQQEGARNQTHNHADTDNDIGSSRNRRPRLRRDYFAQGNCENVVLELMDHLGWLDKLESLLENNHLPEASCELLKRKLEEKRSNTQMVDRSMVRNKFVYDKNK